MKYFRIGAALIQIDPSKMRPAQKCGAIICARTSPIALSAFLTRPVVVLIQIILGRVWIALGVQ